MLRETFSVVQYAFLELVWVVATLLWVIADVFDKDNDIPTGQWWIIFIMLGLGFFLVFGF